MEAPLLLIVVLPLVAALVLGLVIHRLVEPARPPAGRRRAGRWPSRVVSEVAAHGTRLERHLAVAAEHRAVAGQESQDPQPRH